ELGIEFFRPRHRVLIRRGAYGLVSHHLAIFEDRRDIGIDNVMVTVLAAVFYNAHPGTLLLQRLPHLHEHLAGHIRVTNDFMGFSHQLLTGKTTDAHELIVRGDNNAFTVSG